YTRRGDDVIRPGTVFAQTRIAVSHPAAHATQSRSTCRRHALHGLERGLSPGRRPRVLRSRFPLGFSSGSVARGALGRTWSGARLFEQLAARILYVHDHTHLLDVVHPSELAKSRHQ